MSIEYVPLWEKLERLTQLYMKLHEEVGRIAGYAAYLDIFWDGDANEAFMSAIDSDMASAGIYTARIGEAVRAAREAYALYGGCEREVMMMIKEYGL
ncbi:MAG: hypothetical protein K6G58_09190 [Lachnospiraceae bacterium]|nr:hypothetical protein [Lachnospiraceae bacterium]